MARRFRVTLVQMNPTVGDFAGNSALAQSAWEQGRAAGADLVMLTEMFITGYNTQDLVMRPSFVRDAEGRVVRRNLKRELPNETVFDEVRVFDRGPLAGPFDLGGVRIGVPICEDAWHEEVPESLAESGAEILLVPNGSPYCREKF
ncbi:MAG: NAD+ synthase, partial [Boseongicola sp. SB0676_bin_33]|nr:NAD+ synthase [Boseongicola sp. SB0676_bin_33]